MASTADDFAALYTTGDTVAPIGITDGQSVGTLQGNQLGFALWQDGRKTCTASGAITHGAEVAPDAAGKVKAAATGDLVVGMAASESASNNDEIDVWPTSSYLKG
jgi:hypothetical protein